MLCCLNNTAIETPCTNISANKKPCSLGLAPRLQGYYLKKVKKEKLQYRQQTSYFEQAVNNTLHFINNGLLTGLMPYLK